MIGAGSEIIGAGLAAMIPVVAYIRYALGITATSEEELKRVLGTLQRLGVPIGATEAKGEWGTNSTREDRSVQCGLDDNVLPNRMTSGELKDQIEADLIGAGFKQETTEEVIARNLKKR